METWKEKKIYRYTVTILFPVLLVLYPLRHIQYGMEWWDTGYNYANFTYIGNMEPMWRFSTYLANALGHLFTRLPFGNRMIGMNFYTGLTVSILALWGYFFFTNKVKIPPVTVFIGELIAIGLCWCPTALLYNYLTYILLFAGVVFLYYGLTEEKKLWFVLAGICLGLNVFVRFSNLAQTGMIAAVWAYAWICKKNWKIWLTWTGLCLLGYVFGLGSFLLYLSLRYGFGEYAASIQKLFEMTEDAAGYTMQSMVLSQLQNYLQNIIWLLHMLPFVLLGVLGFAVLPRKFLRLKKVGFAAGMLLVFYWLRNQNMFNMQYTTKMSMYQWAICLLTFLMAAGLYTIFSKKATPKEKLLVGLSMLVAVLTPLGSNNHLYSSINNLFFGAPVILWILGKHLKNWKGAKTVKIGKAEVFLYAYPLKAAVLMILGMLLVQSIGFGFGYVFSESGGGENLHTRMENSDILKNMYTDETRAEQLGSLLAFVQEQDFKDREIILYGYIPALSYYLEIPFAITPWPDLPSYNYRVMYQDMERIRERIGLGEKPPLILLEASKQGVLEGSDDTNTDKEILLRKFAEEFEYEQIFSNDKFILFEARE